MPVLPKIRGFTLIELSIVLVIIGLIAASVLVGNELIEAARIRSQISQIQQYTVAVTTFRGKYGGIPGDLEADKAASMGFADRSGAPNHGDGNGTLESCDGLGVDSSDQYFGCETALFWSDLSAAQMISDSLNSAVDDRIVFTDPKPYLPAAKIGADTYFAVFSAALFQSFGTSSIKCEDTFCFAVVKNPIALAGPPAAVGKYAVRDALKPSQAYAIDSKMDDGLPLTGTVLAGSVWSSGIGFSLYYIPTLATTRCVGPSGTTNSYNLMPDNANQTRCIMNIVYR
jgi:prepilin-type N-terminal cleavage/methylation domain-containing protein